MPQKNTLKIYAGEAYYHVYTRGTNKQSIFLDTADYAHFERLFARYLAAKPRTDKMGVTYPNYSASLKLLAFCLMPNHIHLFVYQTDVDTITSFMKSLLTSYSKYFNARHKRVGTLFESRYKAKHIADSAYFEHIARYIHMNPRYWQSWRHSSLHYAFRPSIPEWLAIEECTADFANRQAYIAFLKDYQSQKDEQEAIKTLLADK